MITTSKKEFTFVLYGQNGPFRCFQLNKKFVKSLIVIIPSTILFLIFFSVFIWSYLKNVTVALEEKTPKLISSFQEEKNKWTEEKEILEKELTELRRRMSEPARSEHALSLFKPIKGVKNLSSQGIIKIESLKISNKNKDLLKLRFNLSNARPLINKKLSGHIFVILEQPGSLTIYPELSGNNEITQLSHLDYTSGESFFFSRLRPVKVNMKLMQTVSNKSTIYVLIFSNDGDIIHQERFNYKSE